MLHCMGYESRCLDRCEDSQPDAQYRAREVADALSQTCALCEALIQRTRHHPAQQRPTAAPNHRADPYAHHSRSW